MGKVTAGATVSLDGYIAGSSETGTRHLLAWLNAGEHEFPSANPGVSFHLTEADHRFFREINESVGVYVIGRRLFDITDGWGGIHPFDRPIVVVTHSIPADWIAAHPYAPFTFVTNGIEAAVERAREIAGELDVIVTAGKLASECLDLGLLDELWLDLVPVLLGSGVRFFDRLKAAPILLDGPDLLVEGSRVTHLRYQVRRS
jgi:dihydrofolate reductase